MDFSNLELVQMFCPNCGHKITGYKDADGALRRSCDKCKVVIFSRRKNSKKFSIEITSKQICNKN